MIRNIIRTNYLNILNRINIHNRKIPLFTNKNKHTSTNNTKKTKDTKKTKNISKSNNINKSTDKNNLEDKNRAWREEKGFPWE